MVAVKLWIAWPPNSSKASNAKLTVTWVMTERDSVWLTEALSKSGIGIFL